MLTETNAYVCIHVCIIHRAAGIYTRSGKPVSTRSITVLVNSDGEREREREREKASVAERLQSIDRVASLEFPTPCSLSYTILLSDNSPLTATTVTVSYLQTRNKIFLILQRPGIVQLTKLGTPASEHVWKN